MEHKKGEPHMDKRGNISSRNMRLFGGIIRMCEQVAASGNTLILYSA